MDIITISLIVVICAILALGFVVIKNSREKLNRIYSINILTIIGWGLAMIFYRMSSDDTIIIWSRLLYVSASLIASSFLYFTYVFPVYSNIGLRKKMLIFLPNIVLILIILFGNNIITGAQVNSNSENYIFWGKLYFVYVIYILSYFNFAFIRLYYKIKNTSDPTQKQQTLYVLLGYGSSGVISFISNLILPSIGIFSINWLGQISTILMATSATYAIVKHHLFSTKVITTELLTFALWITLLIRLMVGETLVDHIANGITLFFTFFVGLFLIKSVIREVNQREKIEKLAVDLKRANTRLLELDKQKSEFVSFASHQLRAPLTAMKGYASLLIEGEFGEIKDEVKGAIKTILDSSKTLTNIVDDYLNVSRIELGTMKYSFEIIDYRKMVRDVVEELKPNIQKSKLDFSLHFQPDNESEKFIIHADKDKFKQVITNLIDNSIKYTPSGSLDISLVKNIKDKKILFSVKDTGVGISPEAMPKLFSKFVRLTNANKQNIYGTGLGLFVAKDIVTAHQGKIWAESDGEGKGSVFNVEIDMAA